jgi:hypothetical protein
MSLDPTTLLIGVAAGGAAGLGMTADDLEKSRREMRMLLLERDLLSAALTKVYEAENEGKITREEREMIAKRYSSQIRDLESKLSDKELIVEVGELEGLRDELMTLFREKIQNIESRLDQAKERLPSASQQQGRGMEAPTTAAGRSKSSTSVVAAVSAQSSQSEDLERAVERKAPKRDDTEGERRVKAIRDEVMEALERLEQIDSRKESEGT